jgi:hypothetical protein
MKIFAILSFSLFLRLAVMGQEFMQSAGVAFSIMNTQISNQYEKYSSTLEFANLTYFPRYIFIESKNTSFSGGIPIGVGLGFASSGAGGSDGVYWGIDLPAVFDYNIGRRSTSNNDSKFGTYFGAGFGYAFTNWSDGSSAQHVNSYGPLIRSGIRFGVGDEQHPDWALSIGISFKYGLEAQNYKTYGISVMIDF